MDLALGVDDRPRVVLADGGGRRGRPDEPTRRVITRFAAGTLLALLGIVAVGFVAGTRLSEQEALKDLQRLTQVVAYTAVEPNADALADEDEHALAALDNVVRGHLLPHTDVDRVKLWSAEGKILYSDAPELMGQTFPLDPQKLQVIESFGSDTGISDLAEKENLFERSHGGRMLEVYTGVRTQDGPPLLFEAYVGYDGVEERRSVILRSFAWAALLCLGLFAVVQISLAFTNLRWLQRKRERLLHQATQAAEGERRRVARDVHDGVVQDLIGASYVVDGAVAPLRGAGRADLAEALRDAVAGIRTSIRGLRSMIIDIYPATLRTSGLRAALHDLIAPLQARGTDVELELPDELELPPHVETTLYRAAQEGVRNATRHGRADSITIAVRLTPGSAELVVRDDGAGHDPEQPCRPGHVGLLGLADLAEELGGVLEIASAPGRGTELRMELPR